MTNVFKRRFDALAGPAFLAAGMADAAIFQRGRSAAIPMTEVYVDDGVESFGGDAQVPTLVTTIRLFKRFNIPKPAVGDRITIGAEVFLVDALNDEDSSSYVVIVAPEKK